MERGKETFPLLPLFIAAVKHMVIPSQDVFSTTSLSLVVPYRLKSTRMNYTAHQHVLVLIIFLLSHPVFAFNFDCLKRILSYINSVLGQHFEMMTVKC